MAGRSLIASLLTLLAPIASAAPTAPVRLGVWPTHVVVAVGVPQRVHVRNGGRRAVTLRLRAAGFGLDVRGEPHVSRAGDAAGWLAVRPRRIRLAPGATRTLVVRASVPLRARPGDHPALLLLRTALPAAGAVGVRLQVGVVVDVRVPGAARRRIVVRGLRAVHTTRGLELALAVANRGDLTERVDGSVELDLWRGARRLARLRARPRDLLPHSRGIVAFPCPALRRGPVRALLGVRSGPEKGVMAAREFRLRI